MRAVQIGILAALVVCAGLLYSVFRSQQTAPVPVQTAAAPAAAQLPAPVEPPAVEPAAEIAPPAPPVERRPSPAPVARRSVRETPRERAAPAPAPAPKAAEEPAPAPEPEPQATPEPERRIALTPPSGVQQAPPVPAPRVPQQVTIPAGTLISVRLGETLSSDRNETGDTFTATLDQPLVIEGLAVAERGARVQGRVAEADKAGRVRGLSALAIQLTRLHTSDGQQVAIQTETFRKEGASTTGDDAKKIGAGAAIGAAIGAIAGGGKGAAIGAGVGGAAGTGTVMATRGKPAELPVETRLSFRLQEAVTLTERLK